MRSTTEDVIQVTKVIFFCYVVLFLDGVYEGRIIGLSFSFFALVTCIVLAGEKLNLHSFSVSLLLFSLIGLYLGPMQIEDCIEQKEIRHWRWEYETKNATRWSKNLPIEVLNKFENGEVFLHYDLAPFEELPDELKADPLKGQVGNSVFQLIVHSDLRDESTYDRSRTHWQKDCEKQLGVNGFVNRISFSLIGKEFL